MFKKNSNLLLRSEERGSFFGILGLASLFLLLGLFVIFFGLASNPKFDPTVLWVGFGSILIGTTTLMILIRSVQSSIWSIDLLKAADLEKNQETAAAMNRERLNRETEVVLIKFNQQAWYVKVGVVLWTVFSFLTICYGIATMLGYFPAADWYLKMLAEKKVNPLVDQIIIGGVVILAGFIGLVVVPIFMNPYKRVPKPDNEDEWPEFIEHLANKHKGKIH